MERGLPLTSDLRASDASDTLQGRHRFVSQLSWVLFDGTRGPYSSLVSYFVFAPYFATVVVANPVRGQSLWSYTSAIAAALLAVGGPIAGAIADASGRRKPWIVFFMAVGIASMATLWFARPGMGTELLWVMVALVAAAASVDFAQIFVNAMLPGIAPRARIGTLSAIGLACVNVSNLAVLLLFLVVFHVGRPYFGFLSEQHEAQRAAGPLAAAWWLVFGLPLLLFTKDSAAKRRPLMAVREGWRQLSGILSRLSENRNTTRFLIARMLYGEGFVVLTLLVGVYAAGVLRWEPRLLLAQGLINSVCAATAAFFAAWLDRRIGTRMSTLIFVTGCLVTNISLATLTSTSVFFIDLPQKCSWPAGLFPCPVDQVFAITMALAAVFVTLGAAASRAFMAKLAPSGQQTEFFGLYALAGTATSFVGPLLIGLVTTISNNQTAALLVGVIAQFAGLMLLVRVREAPDLTGSSRAR